MYIFGSLCNSIHRRELIRDERGRRLGFRGGLVVAWLRWLVGVCARALDVLEGVRVLRSIEVRRHVVVGQVTCVALAYVGGKAPELVVLVVRLVCVDVALVLPQDLFDLLSVGVLIVLLVLEESEDLLLLGVVVFAHVTQAEARNLRYLAAYLFLMGICIICVCYAVLALVVWSQRLHLIGHGERFEYVRGLAEHLRLLGSRPLAFMIFFEASDWLVEDPHLEGVRLSFALAVQVYEVVMRDSLVPVPLLRLRAGLRLPRPLPQAARDS